MTNTTTTHTTATAISHVTATIISHVTVTVTPVVNPQSGEPTTWSFTSDNINGMAYVTVGMTLGFVGFIMSVFSLARSSTFRKPLYWMALIESVVSNVGLTTGVYYVANLFVDCYMKLWITTFPINVSAVFMCAAMHIMAEATIVSRRNKMIFRAVNGTLILAQFAFLLTRIGTTTAVNNNTKGTCTITTPQVWRVLPLAVQMVSVILATSLFVASLINKGLLRGNMVVRMVSHISKTKTNTKNAAPQQQHSQAHEKIQNLAVRVQLLGLGLVCTTFILFIFQMLSETGAQGAPSGSANTFFGLRTFFLSAACYANGMQLDSSESTSHGQQSHGHHSKSAANELSSHMAVKSAKDENI